jgi:hypothetical protein
MKRRKEGEKERWTVGEGESKREGRKKQREK